MRSYRTKVLQEEGQGGLTEQLSYRKGDNEVLQNNSLTGRGTLRSYRTTVLQEGGQ